jgi:hypothetical protein
MEYPQTNPTEIENELNYLSMKSIEAFKLRRQGLLDAAGYELAVLAMDNQKAILNLRHQGVPIKTELNDIMEEVRHEDS